MKRLKGASTRKELSSFFQSSSSVFHRRRNEYLLENASSKPIVRSYNRSRVPRLRWTDELHQCFVNAVQRLGGEDKATPKMILPMMNVKGLTLSHIKSHLQMLRILKNDVIFQEFSEMKQVGNGDYSHLCFSRHKNYHGRLANIHHELHYKHSMHNGILGSEVNWTKIDKETNHLIPKEPLSKMNSEASRTTVSRKKEVMFEANDDMQNALDPFVASLSSPTFVDIELTLGGPYASLRSCESDNNVYV